MGRHSAGSLRLPLVRGQVSAILVTSLVSSLYGIVVAIASASLLFAGPLSSGLAMGAGAALLGSLAGGMLVTDIVSAPLVAPWPYAVWIAEGIGAALVVAIGWWWNRRVASLEPRVKT